MAVAVVVAAAELWLFSVSSLFFLRSVSPTTRGFNTGPRDHNTMTSIWLFAAYDTGCRF
jgi:hypothetical protein